MDDDQITWRDVIKGSRFAGFSSFIKDECFIRGLALKIDIDKGWLTETVRIEVSGKRTSVERLERDVYASMDDYNKRVSAKP